MAGWISSKIKAAENLLQQIDQQAAESLGKEERHHSLSEVTTSDASSLFSDELANPSKRSISDQDPASNKSLNLPRKKPPPSPLPLNLPQIASRSTTSISSPAPADADWTELLSSPSKPTIRKNERIPHMLKAVSSRSSSSTSLNKISKKREESIDAIAGSGSHEKTISESSSESDSETTSDSEDERERREERRKRREAMMAEAAAQAIRERENLVVRLETEKQSLEKVLQEREREQAQEATELQVNAIETMEAVELEKRRHSNTRMEALARLAKLEVMNGELSQLLAMSQRSLELEANRVAELREQIELKEVAQEEYRRKISKISSRASQGDEMESFRRFKLEILDAEYSFISDKVSKLKEKAKNIEENIRVMRRDMVNRTDMETELEKRLDQLSDRLIQKQMQVESLSSEKATLLLRIETVFRILDGTELSSVNTTSFNSGMDSSDKIIDIESGAFETKNRPHDSFRIIQQLDSVFSVGLSFLRRNRKAQIWSVVYLVCLHLWVVYIFMSKSHVSDSS